VFDNPLIFLHFLEQRMRVFTTDNVQTFDELDHLGLYLEYNAYTEVIKDFDHDTQVIWRGFVQCIDEFFSEKFTETNRRTSLRQNMPKRFEEIIDVLAKGNKLGRAKFASLLLNTDGKWRKNFAEKIDHTLQSQRSIRKSQPISSHGQIEMTTFCWQEKIIERRIEKSVDHSQTVMVAMGDISRWHLELLYDEGDILVDVDFRELDIKELSAGDLERLKDDAEVLKAKRVQKAISESGKIGRNSPCPCGSGSKFKNCCMNKR